MIEKITKDDADIRSRYTGKYDAYDALSKLQVMGIVFFVVGLVVVVRALLSIYGGTGGGAGEKY